MSMRTWIATLRQEQVVEMEKQVVITAPDAEEAQEQVETILYGPLETSDWQEVGRKHIGFPWIEKVTEGGEDA